MRILVAGFFVSAGRVGGAEQSVYDLTLGLLDLGHDVTFACRAPDDLDPSFRSVLETMPGGRLQPAGRTSSRFLLEQRLAVAPPMQADMTIFPNYFTPFLPPWARGLGHVVAIIRDLQYRHLPENWPAPKRLWLRATHRASLLQADTVAVISEAVRRDMRDAYGAAATRRVHVVPEPVSWAAPDARAGDPPFGGQRYILSVAAHYAHKNLATLLEAFDRLSRRDDETLLALVGQVGGKLHGQVRRFDVAAFLHDRGLGDRVRVLGYVDDAELTRLYRHATVFAFPSVFEGFGRPPVEALGMGVPTLTTREWSLEEVTLGSACYVEEPFSVDEWTTRLADMLEDPERFQVREEVVRAVRDAYDRRTVATRLIEATGVT